MDWNTSTLMALAAAQFFKSLGRDYATDESFYHTIARNLTGAPSAADQIAQAINVGTAMYAASRGAVVHQPQTNPGQLNIPSPSSRVPADSTGVACTDVTQYVTETTKAVRDLSGPNSIEVFPSFTNHYGDAVTCGYYVHHDGSYGYSAGFGGYQYDVDPGKTLSLGTVGIASDNGEIEWACYPKSQNANFCLRHRIGWSL